VSAGSYHTCSLDDTGVVCWGNNLDGQSTMPSLSNPVDVSTGLYHTCVLDDTGVVCRGQTYYGQSTVPTLNNPVAVSAGYRHTCALDDSGVVCWGDNSESQTSAGAGTLNFDTDLDGLLDVIEDTNGNGIVDAGETDRLKSDTDSDGFSDGEEVTAGTDPLDDASFPVVADGDINDDGMVDVRDLLLAMRILSGLYTPTQQEQERWDVAPLVNDAPEPDQQNNVGDYSVLLRKVLGQITF